MAHYADTSALVKLVVAEPETPALRAWISQEEPILVTSDLARTELLRAVRRVAADRVGLARAVLDSVVTVTIATATTEAAGRLDPADLRSLDALHLATALELGDDLTGLLTYDDRLARGARAHGITVLAPA